jgi:YVTN family beta-propeller protein
VANNTSNTVSVLNTATNTVTATVPVGQTPTAYGPFISRAPTVRLVNAKIGIYRDGTWYLDRNGNGDLDAPGTDGFISWGGVPGDLPVVGDWNNSGSTKVGIYRDGTWYLDRNGNGSWDGCGTDACVSWGGVPGDVPVVGKW